MNLARRILGVLGKILASGEAADSVVVRLRQFYARVKTAAKTEKLDAEKIEAELQALEKTIGDVRARRRAAMRER